MSKPLPFDLERLRSWSKEEIVEWIEDGQYIELVFDPPLGQPDPEGRRRPVMVRPKNRAERERRRSKLVPVMEFHAVHEMGAGYKRLKEKGHRNPRDPRTLLREMMKKADPSLLDLYSEVLDKKLRPSSP